MIRLAAVFYGLVFGFSLLGTALWGQWSDWVVMSPPLLPLKGWTWLSDSPWAVAYVYRACEDLVLGIGIGLGLVVFSQWFSPKFSWGRKLTEEFSMVFGPLSWGACFLLALMSGVAEEALFRTTLQPILARSLEQPYLAWILISLLFGLVHTGPKKHYIAWTIFAVVFGLIVGLLYLWRGGLLLPATVHIVVNAFNLKWISNHAPRDWTPPFAHSHREGS